MKRFILAFASAAVLTACGGGTTTTNGTGGTSEASMCQFNQDTGVLAGISDDVLEAGSVVEGVSANRARLTDFAVRTAQTPTHYKDAQVLSCLSMSGRAYSLLSLAPVAEGTDPLMAGEVVLERANALCAGAQADPRRCAVVQAESMIIGARRTSAELAAQAKLSGEELNWTALNALVSDLGEGAKSSWADAVSAEDEAAPTAAKALTCRSLAASACRAQFATTTMMNWAASASMDDETRNGVWSFNRSRLSMLSSAYKALYADTADEAETACFASMDDRACQNKLAGKMVMVCQSASDAQSGGSVGGAG